MVVAYVITLALFALYSYTQIDLNLTLSKIGPWEQFRNAMVQIGYFHRPESTVLFLFLLAALFGAHFWFMQHHRKYSPLTIAAISAALLLGAYPFLSHDLFNYMFDAKILTFYHQNPYLHRAMDFPQAPELLFMHWVHRTYPYGPTFLPITLIPSFLGFGKFIISYGLFRILFALSYLLGVWSLSKMNRSWALFFATHPLVLVEGLMNNHNDLLAVGLTLYGIQLIHSNQGRWGRVLLLISGGIKYLTLPFVYIGKKSSWLNRSILVFVLLLLGYLTFLQEVQAWYFLVLFGFLPYGFQWLRELWIFFAGLLIGYYPFVLYGTWGEQINVDRKHFVMIVFAMINAAVLIARRKVLVRQTTL